MKYFNTFAKCKKTNIEFFEKQYIVNYEWFCQAYADKKFIDEVLSKKSLIAEYEGTFFNPYIDVEYYSKKYKIDRKCVVEHFLKIGQKKGFSPCPLLEHRIKEMQNHFGKEWFKQFFKKQSRLSFLDFGELNDWQKSYEIFKSGLFDTVWYKEKYKDLSGSGINLLLHFTLFGIKELRDPNESFNSQWYKQRYLMEDDALPFIHYLQNWKLQEFNPSPEFSVSSYLYANADVNSAGIEPLAHYLKYGSTEGRPTYTELCENLDYMALVESKCFLADWYLNTNEDLRDSGINAIEHYLLFGEKEGRKPNPYFDPIWYKKEYGVVDKSPLLHYLKDGWKDDNMPSKAFDPLLYFENNNISKKSIGNPLEHFLSIGKRAGLVIKEAQKITSGQNIVIDKDASIIKDKPLRSFITNDVHSLQPRDKGFFSNQLNIHWVIPDFAIGAGGHMTIFRTIRWLEVFGHKNTIWIHNASMHETPNLAYETIVKHFQPILAQVNFAEDGLEFAEGDAIFATDWSSVNYVLNTKYFKRRFYFVQDHEPQFYATGTYSLAAAATYKNDLDCICAGPWLSQLMNDKYGLWARHFWLAVDNTTYNTENLTRKNSSKIFKIAFYARHFTSRRAVELGFLALEQLSKSNLNIEVHSFGAPLDVVTTPFKLIDHGVLSPAELADIYKDCDLGIVFSATNYSLIPQEMMACGLPVAELDTDSTRAVFPDGIVEFLDPNPRIMAEQLKSLVFEYTRLNAMASKASTWLAEFSWEESARIVETGIVDRLLECGFTSQKISDHGKVKASVIIPTYNGGDAFKSVIDSIMTQQTPWAYEVIIVDSGSKDGTLDYIKRYPNIRLYEINSKDFQHGRTRNFAISKAKGEFVAVVTHDALPADQYWLFDLVSALEHYPDAAGAFGSHLAYPDADPYTKKELIDHFAGFDSFPLSISRYTEEEKFESGDIGWRQLLHFYSDNNSCMRKSVWEKFPYPEVNFGEDQAWADLIIKEGFEKVYAKNAVVYHSHDFSFEETRKRAFEEAEFFYDYFGYKLVNLDSLEVDIENSIKHAISIGKQEKWSQSIIHNRTEIVRAKMLGFADAIKV